MNGEKKIKHGPALMLNVKKGFMHFKVELYFHDEKVLFSRNGKYLFVSFLNLSI